MVIWIGYENFCLRYYFNNNKYVLNIANRVCQIISPHDLMTPEEISSIEQELKLLTKFYKG